ncbi:hypothetical protein EDC04DRAFT_2899001 [Pisolithus marmoratus]|nr:hypothetical protein EDC04DRAFT_2899001 [Pisolithus marmoratus]
MPGTVRHSSHGKKGTGGQLEHIRNLECMQTTAAPRPKHLCDLDAATEGDRVNPMAPSQPPPSPKVISNKSQLKPRLKTKTGGPITARSDSLLPSNIQPSFSMAVPNQQFGFRLPAVGEVNSNINHGSQHNVSMPLISSGPQSSHASSICSADASWASTAPTSWASLVCSLSRGNQEDHQHVHGHSSHLKRLALASQSSIKAPHCISHVTPQSDIPQSQAPHLTQQPLCLSLQEDHRQSTTLEVPSLQLDNPMTLPPLNREESDNPNLPPPYPAGLQLHDEDENHDPAGEGNYSDPPIDEASPSEDNHCAESVLWGGKCAKILRSLAKIDLRQCTCAHTAKLVFLPILNTQVRWNIVQIPTTKAINSQLHVIQEQQASASSQCPQTQGMTHPPSAMSQLLGGVNPPIPPVGPAIQGAKPWQIQFYKPVVQDVLKCMKQFSYCNMASINSFPLHVHFNIKAIEYVEEAISKRQSKGLPITDGWWPHYVNDICKLLWESLGNWHLALRKKAHTYVTQCYKWDPENCHEVNLGIVKDLLGDRGAFLRDGIDENGYTNNLTHPALAGLIVDFFYTSSSLSLGKLFPEVFSAEVPRVAVAIAATVLKVILGKMVSSQNEVNFRVGTYTLVYLEILGLMKKKCDTSMIHAKKMKSL